MSPALPDAFFTGLVDNGKSEGNTPFETLKVTEKKSSVAQLLMTQEKHPYVYIMASKRNGTLYIGVTMSSLVKSGSS